MKRKPFALVISGPSGVGKSTFVQPLLDAFPNMKFSVSATTRARRSHEKDGREYHFLSEQDFRTRQANGEFLESAVVHGALYGTREADVRAALDSGHGVLLDVDVQGGVNIKKRLPDDAVLVFLLPPSMQALEERLRKRGTESDETVKRRLAHAPEEIRQMVEYHYVVVNDTIESTEANLMAICRAEALRRARLVDAAGGAAVVEEFLRETARPFGP